MEIQTMAYWNTSGGVSDKFFCQNDISIQMVDIKICEKYSRLVGQLYALPVVAYNDIIIFN